MVMGYCFKMMVDIKVEIIIDRVLGIGNFVLICWNLLEEVSFKSYLIFFNLF